MFDRKENRRVRPCLNLIYMNQFAGEIFMSKLFQISNMLREGKFETISIGDLNKAFFRVSLKDNILDHLIVATDIGWYRVKVLLFDFKNSSALFYSLIMDRLKHLDVRVYLYMDDFIVLSRKDNHDENLLAVMEVLRDF